MFSQSEFLNKSLHINKFRPDFRLIHIRSLDRSTRILEKELQGVNKKSNVSPLLTDLGSIIYLEAENNTGNKLCYNLWCYRGNQSLQLLGCSGGRRYYHFPVILPQINVSDSLYSRRNHVGSLGRDVYHGTHEWTQIYASSGTQRLEYFDYRHSYFYHRLCFIIALRDRGFHAHASKLFVFVVDHGRCSGSSCRQSNYPPGISIANVTSGADFFLFWLTTYRDFSRIFVDRSSDRIVRQHRMHPGLRLDAEFIRNSFYLVPVSGIQYRIVSGNMKNKSTHRSLFSGPK